MIGLWLTLAAATNATDTLPTAAGEVLTLERALQLCDEHQPLLAQAAGNTRAAGARVDEVLGAWLPQVSGSGAVVYNQPLTNAAQSSGTVLSGNGGVSSVLSSQGNGGSAHSTLSLTANQLLYDFNQTLDKIKSTKAAVAGYEQTERETLVQAHLAVRSAYYNARALKALLDVARDTLENEKKHLALTEKQIAVGVQPGIALLTEKSTYANDVYQLINAEGSYLTGKALLNQAMGVEGPVDYDVLPVDAAPVEKEGQTTDELMDVALRDRPAYVSMERQIDAQELLLSSYKENLLPNILGQAGVIWSGTRPENFDGNFFAQLLVTWPIFNWTTWSDIREQQADLDVLFGQRDQVRQQVRTDIGTARLQVATYISSVKAAEEVVTNTREQLAMAEGRYKIGVGNVIELGDAQVAYNNAQAQRIQAQFNLNNARATLIAKLGQK